MKNKHSHVQVSSFSLSQSNFTTRAKAVSFSHFPTFQSPNEEEELIFEAHHQPIVCTLGDNENKQAFTWYSLLSQSFDIGLHHFHRRKGRFSTSSAIQNGHDGGIFGGCSVDLLYLMQLQRRRSVRISNFTRSVCRKQTSPLRRKSREEKTAVLRS